MLNCIRKFTVTLTILDELADKIDIQYTKVRKLMREFDDTKLYDRQYLIGLLRQINIDRKFIYHLRLVAGERSYVTNEYFKLKRRYDRREKIIKTL